MLQYSARTPELGRRLHPRRIAIVVPARIVPGEELLAQRLALGQAVPLAIRGKVPVASWAPTDLPEVEPGLMQAIAQLYKSDTLLGPALAQGMKGQVFADQVMNDGNRMNPAPGAGRQRVTLGAQRFAEAIPKHRGSTAVPPRVVGHRPRMTQPPRAGTLRRANRGRPGRPEKRPKGARRAIGGCRWRMWRSRRVVSLSRTGRRVSMPDGRQNRRLRSR